MLCSPGKSPLSGDSGVPFLYSHSSTSRALNHEEYFFYIIYPHPRNPLWVQKEQLLCNIRLRQSYVCVKYEMGEIGQMYSMCFQCKVLFPFCLLFSRTQKYTYVSKRNSESIFLSCICGMLYGLLFCPLHTPQVVTIVNKKS